MIVLAAIAHETIALVSGPRARDLRLCGAPKFIRHIHAMQKRLEARFGEMVEADAVVQLHVEELVHRQLAVIHLFQHRHGDRQFVNALHREAFVRIQERSLA